MARAEDRGNSTGNKTKVGRSRLGGLKTVRKEGGTVILSQVPPEVYKEVVLACARLGGVASFGSTSSDDAAVVTLYLDDERHKEYFRTSADLVEWAENAIMELGTE